MLWLSSKGKINKLQSIRREGHFRKQSCEYYCASRGLERDKCGAQDKGMTKAIVLQSNYSRLANYLRHIYKLTAGKQRKDFSSYTPT